jgi:type 1 glutamine amidotransferase
MMSLLRTRRWIAGSLLLAVMSGAAGCDGLRAIFPAKVYETEPPELPSDLAKPAMLIFTKTNGFRHKEAIPAGLALFETIAKRRGWSLFHTENGAVFNRDQLSRFDATLWHNTSGDTLNEEQKVVFKEWLEAGGGFVGIHGAGGDFSYDWDWYVEELIGAQFIGHTMGPQFQDAKAVVEDRTHPATLAIGESWIQNEEWYSFDASVRDKPGYRVLVSVDESTYSPQMKMLFMSDDIAMGDHPVVWTHCVGRGRALFSALGHQASAYAMVENAKLLEGAVAWAARLEGAGCE